MIFITGDVHGELRKFSSDNLKKLKHNFTQDDYIIICGDFGGIWDGGKGEQSRLDWLNDKPFKTLFITGNHENYDLLAEYPVTEWHGGRVQKIRDNILRLMNGQVFDIDGYSFFTMGGATCHDIQDGILEPDAPDFHRQLYIARKTNAMMRINHYSWWKEEIPSPEEMEEGRKNLEKAKWKVDAVITHCAPTKLNDEIGYGLYPQNVLTDYLEEIKNKLDFKKWYFGHYHDDIEFCDGFQLLYNSFINFNDDIKLTEQEENQQGEITW